MTAIASNIHSHWNPIPAAIPTPKTRRQFKPRIRHHGMFAPAAGTASRLSKRELVERAELLPTAQRSIMTGYYHLALSVKELASLHKTTPTRMWRTLSRVRLTLSDPNFLLAARFLNQLPPNLQPLARERWLDCRPLRHIARSQNITLHHVRQSLAQIHQLLLELLADPNLSHNSLPAKTHHRPPEDADDEEL